MTPMDTKALDPKALDAAWLAVSGAGYKHLEPLVADAITAYLAALSQPAAPDHTGLVAEIESRIGSEFDGECHLTEELARSVIAALSRVREPVAGWVLVPIEPTEEMLATQGKSRPDLAKNERTREIAENLNTWVRKEAAQIYREMIAATPPAQGDAAQPAADGWRTMDSAPKDGTIVEVRSALKGNPNVFLAGYVRPTGLVMKCWCPVKGQKVGGLPWKDNEVDAWRPASPAPSQEGADQ